MDNKETIVEEYRIQKVGNKMPTTKTNKSNLDIFDDKRFYVNNFKSYPHDENLYLFKRDSIKKINNTTLELDWGFARVEEGQTLLHQPGPEAPSLLDKNQLVNNFLEPDTNDDRKLVEAAIRLYND